MTKLISFGVGFAMGCGLLLVSKQTITQSIGGGLLGGGLVVSVVSLAQWVENEI